MSSNLKKIFFRTCCLRFFCALVAGTTLMSCAQVKPDDVQAVKADSATGYVPLADIVIADEFDLKTLTTSNVGEYSADCMDQPRDDGRMAKVNSRYADYLKKVKQNPGKTTVTSEGHVDSGKAFVYYRDSGTCIAKSENLFPVFPIGAFTKTVNPNGLSAKTEKDWYRAIALTIAETGNAKVAYRFNNGNAMVAQYWTDSIMELRYSNEFRKKGQWENEALHLTFSDPALTGIDSTKYNKKKKKFPVFRHLLNQKSNKKPLLSASL